jgi:hypothetical protein
MWLMKSDFFNWRIESDKEQLIILIFEKQILMMDW